MAILSDMANISDIPILSGMSMLFDMALHPDMAGVCIPSPDPPYAVTSGLPGSTHTAAEAKAVLMQRSLGQTHRQSLL